MQADLFQTMTGILQDLGHQLLILNDTMTNEELSAIDYGFRRQILKEFDYCGFFRDLTARMPLQTVVRYTDNLFLNYCFVKIPDHIQIGQPAPDLPQEAHTYHRRQLLCIGPILFQPISSSLFQRIVQDNRIPEQLQQDYMEFYNRIPLFPSQDSYNCLINYFLSRLTPLPLALHLVYHSQDAHFGEEEESYEIPQHSEFTMDLIEQRYQKEAEMMQAVAAGNYRDAEKAMMLFKQYKFAPRSPNPLRNRKNLLITFNTLLRKAAQNGSVHPLHIDNLSRQFAIQIESSISETQLNNLESLMIRKYCLLVTNYSRKKYSALVQTCLDYIDFHYFQELSLGRLARMCNVSGSYLSGLFKKEVDMTLTDYINNTRVRQALTLLNTTSLSVQEIGARCGFPDANYFSRIFKKLQGKSPKSYRDSVLR